MTILIIVVSFTLVYLVLRSLGQTDAASGLISIPIIFLAVFSPVFWLPIILVVLAIYFYLKQKRNVSDIEKTQLNNRLNNVGWILFILILAALVFGGLIVYAFSVGPSIPF